MDEPAHGPHLHEPLTGLPGEPRARRWRLALVVFAAAVGGCAWGGMLHGRRSNPVRAATSEAQSVAFEARQHPMDPGPEWGNTTFPLPTNAWWLNFVVADPFTPPGSLPAAPLPYAVRAARGRGLEVSYGPTRRAVTEKFMGDYFAADLILRAGHGVHRHEMVYVDDLTASVRIREAPTTSTFIARLARGAPWIVTEWQEGTPVIESEFSFAHVSVATAKSSSEGPSTGPSQPSTEAEDLPQASSSPRPSPAAPALPPSPSPAPSELPSPAASTAPGPTAFAPSSAPAKDSALCAAHPDCAPLEATAPGGACCPVAGTGVMLVCCTAGSAESTPVDVLDVATAAVLGPADLFAIHLSNGQHWLLSTDSPVQVVWTADRVAFQAAYAGRVRVAIATDHASAAALARFAHGPHAVRGRVRADSSAGDMATLRYEWTAAGGPAEELITLALPLHEQHMTSGHKLGAALRFDCMKGPMVPLLGESWSLAVPLARAGLRARRGVPKDKVQAIQDALAEDLGAPGVTQPLARDPYFFGKEAARLARLVLVAEELGADEEAGSAAEALAEALGPWLSRGGPLVYDRTYGGIVSAASLDSERCLGEFGNAGYNDHHFHYGYLLHAAAVACRAVDGFCDKHREALHNLVSDIAQPPSDHGGAFPVARHKDLYDWHSWASGLYPMANGRQQESSSEAANGYYGAALAADALGDEALGKWAKTLLAMEQLAAQAYWQVPKESTLYAQRFVAQQRMVGIVSSTDVNVATWFGWQAYFVHGINVLPVTPATEDLLPPAYVRDQLEQLLPLWDETPAEWRAFTTAARAIVDPDAAAKDLEQIDSFDDGNSRTNMLHWIATRPPRPEAGAAALGDG